MTSVHGRHAWPARVLDMETNLRLIPVSVFACLYMPLRGLISAYRHMQGAGAGEGAIAPTTQIRDYQLVLTLPFYDLNQVENVLTW